MGGPRLRPDGKGKPIQVRIIRDALAACPDEVPLHDKRASIAI